MARDTDETEDLVKIGDGGRERLNDREQNKERDQDGFRGRDGDGDGVG